MKTFLIITGLIHKKNIAGRIGGYGPYIREMNLWIKYFDEVLIVAPIIKQEFSNIDLEYSHKRIKMTEIPAFNLLTAIDILRTILLTPYICLIIANSIMKADHIHIRCPNNTGLLGCFVQILFPKKRKTAKYASNWDWSIKQPCSYRLQQRILRNTFLTRNMTALVYGEWPDRTKNIKPFFTASYSVKDRLPVIKKALKDGVKLAFVGTLTPNKSPLAGIEVIRELTLRGINAEITYCGEGPERQILERKTAEYGLTGKVKLLGNVDSEKVKEVLIQSHFLIFLSRSEGWPKAVSEAMWWGCLPITTPVSCVPWMLDNGARGELVNGNIQTIASLIEEYFSHQERFNIKSEKAMQWSREYTLERFREEIKKFVIL